MVCFAYNRFSKVDRHLVFGGVSFVSSRLVKSERDSLLLGCSWQTRKNNIILSTYEWMFFIPGGSSGFLFGERSDELSLVFENALDTKAVSRFNLPPNVLSFR